MKPALVAVHVVVGLTLATLTPAWSQSLAQIAEMEPARRKAMAHAAPVLTDADLQRGSRESPQGATSRQRGGSPDDAPPGNPEPERDTADGRSSEGSSEPRRFLYTMSISGLDAGRVPVAISQDDVWVDRSALERAGLRSGAGRDLLLDGTTYVALTSLTRELGYEVDERNGILRLSSRSTHLIVRPPESSSDRPGLAHRYSPPAPLPNTMVGTTDSGSGTVVFQFNRNTIENPVLVQGPLSALVVPATSHANLRVDSRQYVTNFGWVEGSVDLADQGGTLAATKGFIGMSDVSVGAWRMNLRTGDRPLAAYALPLGVTALPPIAVGVRGGQVDLTRGGIQLSAFGGRTTALGGYFGESVLASAQSVVGARLVAQPDSRLRVAAGLLGTNGSDARDRVTPARTIGVSGSALFDPTPHVTLAADTSIAQYGLSSDAERPGESRVDASYLFAGRVNGTRGRSELDVLRLGPTYLPLSFTRVGDRAGALGTGDYRFGNRVQIDGTVQHWSTNVGGWSTAPGFDVDTGLLGLRYALTGATHAGARLGLSSVQQRPQAAAGSNQGRSVNADLSHQHGAWLFEGRLSDILARQGSELLSGGSRRRLDFDVRRTWRNGSSFRSTIGVILERLDQANQSIMAGGAGVSLPVRQALSFYAEANWNQEIAQFAGSRLDTFAASAAVDWTVARGFRLSANARVIRYAGAASSVDAFSSIDIGLLTADGQDALARYLDRMQGPYQFTIRVQKDLSWGSRPLVRQAAGGAPVIPRGFGRIEGSVFNDLDGDGIRGASEPGVPDAVLRLGGVTAAKVDADGRFAFPSVPVGDHTLSLDLTTVPASYDIGSRETVLVHVGKRTVTRVNFPLVLLGRIRGWAVVVEVGPDDPRPAPTAADSAPERPAAGITVQLDADVRRTTITDADGEFEFSGVVRGNHAIRVVTESLPASWRASEPAINVSLGPGERVGGVRLVIMAGSPATRRVTFE
ncbi:MAG: hypothetical protein DMF89_09645 [Acidobacteria bacterium]|nr:MAG: hypothetical protein DMF89_09645 [Acidobacteriota bacterium]